MSVSSSEEEGASTPEYTSCEDVEIESESVSEKGKDFSVYYAHGHDLGKKKNLYFSLSSPLFNHTLFPPAFLFFAN